MDLAQLDQQQTEDRIRAEAAASSEHSSTPAPSDPSPAPVPSGKDRQSRRWMLTLPESEYDRATVEKRLGNYKAVVGQLEAAPTTGYLHWQLYLESKSAVRFSTLRKLFPQGHYTPARETRIQCVRYCTREDKRAQSGVVLELGAMSYTVRQGKRTDIDAYHDQIMLEGKSADQVLFDDPRAAKIESQLRSLELIRDRETWGKKFRQMEVRYLHGGTRTGKTSSLYETYGFDDLYRVPNWRNPFDGYRGQDILLLDEYNTSVPVVELLKILEGYPLEVAARYADKTAKFTKVFIVSNLRLQEQHLTIQQEHPNQWEAILARITSISEMIPGGKLVVEKGTPPQLDHFLSGKPVKIVPATAPAPSTDRFVTIRLDQGDDFEDGEFAEEADEFFGD